ncbi:MAG TPA: membrane dipeptidase [Candidatus Heimdallarchaeota archaeon]|nr:membrane dipeptidase [Candidatus Heimdallarchaeota archaeon]
MISREEYLKLPLKERFIKLSNEENDRAERLFRDLVTVDLHTHIFGSIHFSYDYELVRQSGMDCCFEAVPTLSEDFAESMELLGKYKQLVAAEPGLVSATRTDEILQAKQDGKQAVMYQLEPQTIGRKLERIEIAYGLGVRMMLLTFNTKNYLGDGCTAKTDTGLSYLGIEVVGRLNDIGILVDLSHCGIQTTLDAIKFSKGPVLFNHTGACALNPGVARLKNDEQLKALADKGGVVGISAIPNQLSSEPEQGIEDMLNHIDYVKKLIGGDHVAIGLDNIYGDQVGNHREMAASKGTDFAQMTRTFAADYMYGIESPLEWRNIIRGLISRGYSDEEIEKIVGANALRIMKEVVG